MPAERDHGQSGRYFEMNSLVSASVEGVRAQLATVGEARCLQSLPRRRAVRSVAEIRRLTVTRMSATCESAVCVECRL